MCSHDHDITVYTRRLHKHIMYGFFLNQHDGYSARYKVQRPALVTLQTSI